MGQDISRDSSGKSPNIIEDPIQTYESKILNSEPIDGYIRIVKRADSSSVKELYIPKWRISFFKEHGTIQLVENCNSDCAGKYIQIDADSGFLLYNAWHKFKESKDAFTQINSVFGKFIDNSVKF
jgi:uncharacterized protein YbaA (DUF1428 family)